MKILVADDMMSMRHVMIHILHDMGYTGIDEAVDGVQALNKRRKNKYDLLITDHYMPKLNGKQLLDRIRNDDQLTNLPVLIVTCEDEKETVKTLIDAKATCFIIKPFSTNTLKQQLNLIEKRFYKKNNNSGKSDEINII